MKIIIIITLLIQAQHAFSKHESTTELVNLLYQLKSEKYTGGLPKKNRELAAKIRKSMLLEFPISHCDDPDPMKGVMLGNLNDKNKSDPLDISQIKNKNIRSLIEGMNNNSQEIRDSSAYTLSLFGPSIRQIVPYIKIKRSNDDIKGNWYNHALSKIDCVNWVAADFRRVIPNKLLPEEEPWRNFLQKSSLIVTNLYSHPDIEYPPEMLNHSFGNYGFSDNDQKVVKSLFKLLMNNKLSDQKRIESALALLEFKIQESTFPNDDLIPLLQHQNKDFTQIIEELIIYVKHPYGIKLIINYLNNEVFWGWNDIICEYDEHAIELEDKLINTLSTYKNSSSKIGNIYSLGCIKSKKAVPILLKLSEDQDWEIAMAALESIGEIGINKWKIRRTLKSISKHSWSKKLRDTANQSLDKLKTYKTPEHSKSEEDIDEDKLEMITIKMGPAAVNHGLPWCNEKGKYSIDGKEWFMVDWQNEGLPKAPEGFPGDLISDYRTHTFYQVEDGWLFGSEKGHYDGTFIFWSQHEEPYYLAESDADVYSIFKHDGKIMAIGYVVFSHKDAGILYEISKDNGKWVASHKAILPSPPFGYAFGPDNELLITDGPNDYAVIDNNIVPLKCELKMEGSYFD